MKLHLSTMLWCLGCVVSTALIGVFMRWYDRRTDGFIYPWSVVFTYPALLGVTYLVTALIDSVAFPLGLIIYFPAVFFALPRFGYWIHRREIHFANKDWQPRK